MSDTLQLAQDLVARPSVTPEDGGCQEIIAARLAQLGFSCEQLNFGEVSNLWAIVGDSGPLFVFAGHTDVVPPGALEEWHSDPFQPSLRDGRLYGRGAADMKSSLAAMVTACERFMAAQAPAFRIGFLITSDEEGDAVNGTCKVLEVLQQRNTAIDYCIVGEPSSSDSVGDVIKIGRRGSLSATLAIRGIQGHVAYPELARNPIHQGIPALAELIAMEWDQGNAAFPPTSLQISNINAGTGAGNVIPDELRLQFNLRYSTETDADTIRDRVKSLLDSHELDYELNWQHSGAPFLTENDFLQEIVRDCIREETGTEPKTSTSGGTSDGRFIAPTGAQVIELGPVNASIHKVNEHIDTTELECLSRIYQAILLRLNQVK